ncbi:MAG: hypothetical protein KME29_08880 [Calothrix sp. FI2-JRJ7]|jgi:DNA-binding MarR family transcriptional regulator|nr:hypothetical protein [Calothrix sp. FI2-JRJ7]
MPNPSNAKILKAVQLTIDLLYEIKQIDVNQETLEQIKSTVLAELGEISPYAPAKIDTIIECLEKLGGSASRAQIAADTNIDPNAISSLLNKLARRGIIKKVLLKRTPSWKRGHKPEYIFSLVKHEDN